MIHELLLPSPSLASIPVWPVTRKEADAWLERQPQRVASWLRASRFAGDAGELVLVPGAEGGVMAAAFGLGAGDDPFAFGAFATKAPAGDYHIDGPLADAPLATLSFLLASYAFTRYRPARKEKERARLAVPAGVDGEAVTRLAAAVCTTRDLVNTPANDMGPDELEAAARAIAKTGGAEISVTTGDALLTANFPLIHAVGKGSARAPRLIDFVCGRSDARKVTLVGKGVCFDTGGLDLKPSSAMLLMKKDMGGAATALGLASLIMAEKLDVRLRVLIPAVENSVSGAAFRPSDVWPSRKGLTVEIGNTDAEGRLVLADALALADEEAPDLLLDFATLTGAARTALGPEIVPFYTGDDALAGKLAEAGAHVADPLWRMPLWQPYRGWLDSKIADTNNISDGAFAGSITAALFLQKFVERAKSWVHFDLYAWNSKPRPGRPVGGEAQVLRALFEVLRGA